MDRWLVFSLTLIIIVYPLFFLWQYWLFILKYLYDMGWSFLLSWYAHADSNLLFFSFSFFFPLLTITYIKWHRLVDSQHLSICICFWIAVINTLYYLTPIIIVTFTLWNWYAIVTIIMGQEVLKCIAQLVP